MYKIGGYRPSTGEIDCEKFGAKASAGFTKLASPIQNSTFIIPEYTPISDQGNLSSCVGNSVCDSLEILKGLEDPKKVKQVSRLFVYYNARAYTNDTGTDSGCYIHFAMDGLSKIGAAEETLWKYNVKKVLIRPSIRAYNEANKNKITTFYHITSAGAQRLLDIETAIRASHPVVFGTAVGSNLENYQGEDKAIDIPIDNIGGHCMMLTGVRSNPITGKKEYLCRNSWGSDFGLKQEGLKGHFWITANYISWQNTNDLFVPTRMIDFTI